MDVQPEKHLKGLRPTRFGFYESKLSALDKTRLLRQLLRRSLWCFPHSSLPTMDLVRPRPWLKTLGQAYSGPVPRPERGSKGLARGTDEPLPSTEAHPWEATKRILSLHDPLDRYWQNSPISSEDNPDGSFCPRPKPRPTAIQPICFGLQWSPFPAKWF